MTKRERKEIYKWFFAGQSVHDILGDLLFIHYPDPVCRESIENILREGWREKWDTGVKRGQAVFIKGCFVKGHAYDVLSDDGKSVGGGNADE